MSETKDHTVHGNHIVQFRLPSWEDAADDGAFEIERRGVEPPKLRLTPVADILMLMLLVWMLSASVRLQSCIAAGTVIPEVEGSSVIILRCGRTVEVLVDASECVFVNMIEVTNFDSLLEALKSEHAMVDSDVLFLLLDPESTHGKRVEVADAAALAGFRIVKCNIREVF